jgi:hypothetical protein
LSAFKKDFHPWGLLTIFFGKELLTRNLYGVIHILQVSLVCVIEVSAYGLKRPGFLQIENIVLDADFGADGFIA